MGIFQAWKGYELEKPCLKESYWNRHFVAWNMVRVWRIRWYHLTKIPKSIVPASSILYGAPGEGDFNTVSGRECSINGHGLLRWNFEVLICWAVEKKSTTYNQLFWLTWIAGLRTRRFQRSLRLPSETSWKFNAAANAAAGDLPSSFDPLQAKLDLANFKLLSGLRSSRRRFSLGAFLPLFLFSSASKAARRPM